MPEQSPDEPVPDAEFSIWSEEGKTRDHYLAQLLAAGWKPGGTSDLWDVEKDVNALATPSQIGKDKRYAKLRMPDAGPIDVRLVDKYLPIFDMSVGILLMLGLLTPVAALAAGIFLASVVLTQFPGYPGTQPTYYQAIEMIGCFVLAFSDAGRYAGLDFLPWSFWNRNKTVEAG